MQKYAKYKDFTGKRLKRTFELTLNVARFRCKTCQVWTEISTNNIHFQHFFRLTKSNIYKNPKHIRILRISFQKCLPSIEYMKLNFGKFSIFSCPLKPSNSYTYLMLLLICWNFQKTLIVNQPIIIAIIGCIPPILTGGVSRSRNNSRWLWLRVCCFLKNRRCSSSVFFKSIVPIHI